MPPNKPGRIAPRSLIQYHGRLAQSPQKYPESIWLVTWTLKAIQKRFFHPPVIGA
jgi:hypothetical protein